MTRPLDTYLLLETFTMEQIKKARKEDAKKIKSKKSSKKSGRI